MEKSFFDSNKQGGCEHPKKVDQRWNERAIAERDSEVPRRGPGEQDKDWETKNRKFIRCGNARDELHCEKSHTEEKIEDKFV